MRSFDKPLVMGIINATPDSFYAASRQVSLEPALARIAAMVEEGADLIDIGGYSSRPGASPVTEADELDRVIPLIRETHRLFPNVLLSIDTFRSQVADSALEAGASVVNDISGGMQDSLIFQVAARHRAPYILMHMRGTPQNMSTLNDYQDLIQDLKIYFQTQVALATEAGVQDILIDPGFGFSKNGLQNFQLLQALEQLVLGGWPVLVGVSRKSMIYKSLNVSPEESLNGTTVVNTIALLKGASVLRVHDVREAKQAVELVELLKNA